MSTINYRDAGVDISAGKSAIEKIKPNVARTFSRQVLNGLGGFGAMYDLGEITKSYNQPVLVQSIDGVGTKIMLACLMNKFDTIGRDLVSATVNDIIVMGATPLTLLDYIANDKLQPDIIEGIISGIVEACLENNISLVGGEMAEMPGTYVEGAHDLVGVVTGVVEKNKIINGEDISAGDIILAFKSSGLHTNGYSLARKLIFEVGGFKVDSLITDFNRPIGEVLLEPHMNYTRPVHALLSHNIKIKGMAHITGGGLTENIPRILPKGSAVEIATSKLPEQAIFNLLGDLGKLDQDEMYRTFNMGIGLVLIVSSEQLSDARDAISNMPEFSLIEIGTVVSGSQSVKMVDV